MEATIRQLQEEAQQLTLNLQSLKGEYFAAMDYVCFRDVNALRADTVVRTRTKQLELITRLDRIHAKVNGQTTDIQQFQVQYHQWEMTLFRNQRDDTKDVM